MSNGMTLEALAQLADAEVRGGGAVMITNVAGVEEAGPADITWVSHGKFADRIAQSKAGAVVISRDFGETPMPALLCDEPEFAIAKILTALGPPVPAPPPGVHESAVVHPSATIGERAAVGPLCIVGAGATIGDGTVLHGQVFVGDDARLGADCTLWPGAVLRERCVLGDRVILHSNVVIGSDGFGYRYDGTAHRKIPQIGTVEIEDDVEIGAGSCIDRAKFGCTRVGRGTKIDNLVQVAHNVTIGPNCIIVAQAGIAGSATLEPLVILGGGVGVRDHVRIASGVQAAAFTGISKDVPAGVVLNGNPAVPNAQYLREKAQIRRLPEWSRVLKELVKRVERLESATDD